MLVEFLNGSNATLRAHTALGLAASRNPSATGLLAGRYRKELDWRVRWAIVTALGQRHELLRNKILELALRLDPAIEVQNAARLPSNGLPQSLPHGTASAMIRLKSSVAGASDVSAGALLLLNPALALPFAPGPDGLLIILGVPDRPIELRVAAPPDLSKSSSRANSAAPEALESADVERSLHMENPLDG
jgi:hypothetical protein